MREMKPLILPKLVAARNSSKTSLDMSSDPASSVHSSADSGFYSVSDCSTPPTPNHPSRGHFRYPSSTSSLSSSPPSYDPLDAPNASGKLPKLTEEPIEREDDYPTAGMYRCTCDMPFCAHPHPSSGGRALSGSWDWPVDYNGSFDSHMAKRRRSGESTTTHSLTNKLENKFPSLTRKVRERKRASTFSSKATRSVTPSRVPSRAASTRIPSTRTSSITSSIHQSQVPFDINERLPSTSARNSRERLDEPATSSPIDIAKANAFDPAADQEEPERFATTPLLPPMLIKTRFDDVPAQSPLQSPSVADLGASAVTTPIDTPPFRAYPTPPLSSKPSVASFKASRPGHMVPSSDIPPMMLTTPDDKWAAKLSHANFTIRPEPYVPEVCDAASLRRLFADWEQARCNFTKHLVRTGEHWGATSKIYRLTEQKWAEVDAVWKSNNDLAISRAAAIGAEPEPLSPAEPAPLSKIPSLNDPKTPGKFPKLGDEDIVGPMVQIASQIQRTPTRKRAFFKFFSDIKFPGSFFGPSRSSAGIRSR